MIVSDIQQVNRNPSLNKYFINGTIFDTCVLFVFLLDKYVRLHPDKKYILKQLNISEQQVSCITAIVSNLGISHIIITPHIFAEFLKRIREEYKDYKKIKECVLDDLKGFEEIMIEKEYMLNHTKFIEFGNDISMTIATERQIKKFKYCSIMSFDGRFIRGHFTGTKTEILAFDLGTLQYFF